MSTSAITTSSLRLVVDEIHLLDSPDRGPTLEVTIAKLRKIIPRLHIIALSATVGNANEIADWLDAECVRSEWRPVDLREGVLLDGTIHFLGRKGADIPVSRAGPVIALVNDTLRDGGQCLIFDSSRRNAVSTALSVSKALRPPNNPDDSDRTDLTRAHLGAQEDRRGRISQQPDQGNRMYANSCIRAESPGKAGDHQELPQIRPELRNAAHTDP